MPLTSLLQQPCSLSILISVSTPPTPPPSLRDASHCLSLGHKYIHKSFNNQIDEEGSPSASYSPCWDQEKMLEGGRATNWIHFPCDRVGCSLGSQHQQPLLGFFFPPPSLVGDGAIGTTLSSSTRVPAVEAAAAAAAASLEPPPSRRMVWAQNQPGTCSRHLLRLLLSSPTPTTPPLLR